MPANNLPISVLASPSRAKAAEIDARRLRQTVLDLIGKDAGRVGVRRNILIVNRQHLVHLAKVAESGVALRNVSIGLDRVGRRLRFGDALVVDRAAGFVRPRAGAADVDPLAWRERLRRARANSAWRHARADQRRRECVDVLAERFRTQATVDRFVEKIFLLGRVAGLVGDGRKPTARPPRRQAAWPVM